MISKTAIPSSVFSRSFFAAFAVAVALGGCGEDADRPATGRASDSGAGEIDVEALRALPYAGSTRVSGDEPSGVIRRDPERSCPGYNLYSAQQLNLAELIDEEGTVLRSWRYSPSQVWENCELLENGDLLVVGAEPTDWPDEQPFLRIADDARYLLRLDWEGRILWKRKLPIHHDVEITPDGKILALTFRRRFEPRIHPRIQVRDDQLTLLATDGTPLESRSLLDAVRKNPEIFPLAKTQPTLLGGPAWVDIFHSNSVEWMRRPELVGHHPLYALDNVLVSFRHQDRIAVFNWTRNEVVWAWGLGELGGPHDAQVLENGNILLFDNGLGRNRSRALELDPLTNRTVWQYVADPPTAFYTATKGSIQRLPNGNTLLAESDRGRAFEVTPAGEIVWEFVCPHLTGPHERATIVRMKRYSHEFVDAILGAQSD